jgi:transposase
MEWLSSLKLEPIDKAMLESDLKLLKSPEEQVESITSKIASLAKESDEVKLLMTLPGIDFAMLIIAEIGDVKRFPEARKLCSWAGLVPVCKQIYVGKWLRWVLVQAAQKAILSKRSEAGQLLSKSSEEEGSQQSYSCYSQGDAHHNLPHAQK